MDLVVKLSHDPNSLCIKNILRLSEHYGFPNSEHGKIFHNRAELFYYSGSGHHPIGNAHQANRFVVKFQIQPIQGVL